MGLQWSDKVKNANTALVSAQQMCVRAGERWSLRHGLQGASGRVTKGKGSFRGEVFKTEKKKGNSKEMMTGALKKKNRMLRKEWAAALLWTGG